MLTRVQHTKAVVENQAVTRIVAVAAPVTALQKMDVDTFDKLSQVASQGMEEFG
jgi:hypothetical protein